MPACDTCRIRKIRCDRQLPCSSCRASKFECSISPARPRKTKLALRQNDGFSSIEEPKSVTSDEHIQEHAKDHVTNTPRLPHTPSEFSKLPSVTLVSSETVEVEDESSLNEHSVAARDLLVRTLDTHSDVRENPKIVTALTSLRQIVEADKAENVVQKPRLTGLHSFKQALYDLKLPPTEVVLKILRKSKDRIMFVFSPPLTTVPREQFTDLCKTVFFRTEDYPTSTAVIVHRILGNLLQEFKWTEDDPALRQQYDDWIQLCRANLEICISNLDLLLPVAMESAQALLHASTYCMEIAQTSLCKKLAVHGCMMVQSLGWHRLSSLKNDSDVLRRQKVVMFWMFYTIDKNLSLRLGQASLIQEYDIDLPLPWVDRSSPLTSIGRINTWVNGARVMSLIYQQLYSPGALNLTDIKRFEAVQELLQEVEILRPTAAKNHMSQIIENPKLPPATYLHHANELLSKSDEITYHALLCMIYRATPASANPAYDPAAECIRSARAALDCHQRCTVVLKPRTELWIVYLHWTIVNTPFVPFTTLFSHVLTTQNRADLQRLHDFADSMADCPTSSPAYKVSRIASVFVSVATVYVESREQAARATRAIPQSHIPQNGQDYASADLYQQSMDYAMPAWAPFNPFLDALGFAEDPSSNMDEVATNANLENWFNGNQHIMGLLEEDLSYLDSTNLNF